jgi:hypothetical protein
MSLFRPKSVPPPPPSSTRPLPSWIAPRPIRSDTRPSPFTRQGRRQTGSFNAADVAQGRRQTGSFNSVEPGPVSARGARSGFFPEGSGAWGEGRLRGDSLPPIARGPAASVLEVAEATSLAPPIVPEPTAVELSLQAEIAALQAALTAAVAETARVRREVLEASAPELVRLAAAIAEQVIGRKIEQDPAILAALAREGIDALLEADEIVVAVAPDLAERIPAEVWTRALEGRATVVVDLALDGMRCEVHGKSSRVAVDPQARLRVVLDALDDAALEAAATSSPAPRSSPLREGAR